MTAHAQNPLEGLPAFAGKYEPIRVLAHGGMGVVFEAQHVRLGHRVAIKVLGEALREHPELVERFEREARAAGSLSSPHAVKVHDIDVTDDGTPFIVMELLAGRDLGDVLHHDGPQPVGLAVGWILEACDALAEAHREGIVHRDVKPSNLFLADVDGRTIVKVLDFGIAKRASAKEASLTQPIAPLGTPQYMSPEQVRCARDVDARSDIWSLGVTLYELVTGRPPFAHEEPSACIASIAADPVPDPRAFRPDLPGPFVAVIMRMLDKDPAKRIASVDDVVVALAPFATLDDDKSGPRAVVRRLTLHHDATLDAVPPRTRRIRSALAAGAAIALGTAALVVTPKCVGPRVDAATAQAAAPQAAATQAGAIARTPPSSPTPITDTALPTALAMPVAPAIPIAAAPATAAPAPTPPPRVALVSAPARVSTPTVTPTWTPTSNASATGGRLAAPAPKRIAEPVAARHFDPGPVVHGGLTGPGF